MREVRPATTARLHIRKPGAQFRHIFFAAVTLLALCHLSSARATSRQAVCSLAGTVLNEESRKPVQGVTVYIPELKRLVISQADGSFLVENLPSGIYRAGFSCTGFMSQAHRVVLQRGETSVLEITLAPSIIEMEAITVTGTPRAQNPLETTQTVDVLAGRSLRRESSGSLGQTLRSFSGVDAITTGANMGKPVIRGLSGKRVRVLSNGVPMEYQQFGVRHAPYLDPMNAARIELVRGPASVLYGSDALGGVINVIPRPIPSSPGARTSLRGSASGQYYSNNAEKTGQLGLQGTAGSCGFFALLTRRQAGNITSPGVATFGKTGIKGDPKFSGELDHTDFEQISGSFGVGRRGPAGALSVYYDFWRNQGNFLLPSGGPLGNNLENDELRIEGRFTAGPVDFRPLFNYQRNLRQANPPGKGRSELPGAIVREMRRDVYTTRLEGLHSAGKLLSGTFGAELAFHDQVTSGDEPLTPSANIKNFAAYLFEEIVHGPWVVTAGARIDHRRVAARPNPNLNLPDIAAGEDAAVLENIYTSFSGSVGGSWHPLANLALTFNLGRGFRAPDVFELHAFGEHGGVLAFQVGDPNLRPETSLNTDISLRWRSPRLKANIALYRNAIDNYIFLLNDSGRQLDENTTGRPVYSTRQTDAVLKGLDLGFQVSLTPWLAWRNSYSMVNGTNRLTAAELPLMSPDRVNWAVVVSPGQLGPLQSPRIALKLKHTWAKKSAGVYEPFAQFDFDIPFGVASTSAYTLLDLDFGFDLQVGADYITVNIGVLNLANKGYRDFLDTYKGYAMSPGRNIYIKLSTPFNLI